MPSPTVIRAENVSKKYVISHLAKQQTLRDAMHHGLRLVWRRLRWNARLNREEFWALKDVSFEVKQGEVLGIIGRNGAGKSTLLKILSRITEPTTGRISINGRVASLLEVGTGFHPELTGRENIFLNGAILGMSRAEVRAKFDEIVTFAEIDQFIDTPVKRYSSGMYVRLAFAVAAHLEPEILIVDEVLAVGDTAFQRKCLGRMEQISASTGRTILIVSHQMTVIQRLARHCLLLERGRPRYFGVTGTAVQVYSANGNGGGGVFFDVTRTPRAFRGSGEAHIRSLRFDQETPHFDSGKPLCFVLSCTAVKNLPRSRVSLTIFAGDSAPVASGFSPECFDLRAGPPQTIRITIPSSPLAPGRYFCGVALGSGQPATGHRDYDVVLETLHFEVLPLENELGVATAWPQNWGHVILPEVRVEDI